MQLDPASASLDAAVDEKRKMRRPNGKVGRELGRIYGIPALRELVACSTQTDGTHDVSEARLAAARLMCLQLMWGNGPWTLSRTIYPLRKRLLSREDTLLCPALDQLQRRQLILTPTILTHDPADGPTLVTHPLHLILSYLQRRDPRLQQDYRPLFYHFSLYQTLYLTSVHSFEETARRWLAPSREVRYEENKSFLFPLATIFIDGTIFVHITTGENDLHIRRNVEESFIIISGSVDT
ncbi:hypothetical protein MMC27_006999 [Xylographa pallens]|nr:hypothetical protein [Xylographa pallens]